jgi:hypothetical protein
MVSETGVALEADYYRSLTRSYIADSELDRALEVIATGLSENPQDAELLKLRGEIETTRAQATKKEEREDQEKRSRDLKATAASRLVNEKQILPRAYHGCLETKRRAEKRIADENAIAAISGFVNKVTLRDAGQQIANINKIVKYMARDSRRLGIVLDNEKVEAKSDADDAIACDAYFRRHFDEIDSQ